MDEKLKVEIIGEIIKVPKMIALCVVISCIVIGFLVGFSIGGFTGCFGNRICLEQHGYEYEYIPDNFQYQK